MSDMIPLGPGREFDLIRDLIARWGPRARGLGDDAAVLSAPPGEALVVSTDTSVEDVHFRRAWLSLEDIGWRAAMAALSDLAAMGASPLGMTVALVLPSVDVPELKALGDGIGAAAEAARIAIVGGDLTRGEQLTLAVTVLGSARRPLRRSGAQPGDRVYVTGRLGGPAKALASYLRGDVPDERVAARFSRPIARIREGLWLGEQGATAAIDISDGIVGDAQHLAAASRAQIAIDVDTLPLFDGANTDDALQSGEEYELLVTVPGALEASRFRQLFDLPLTTIGSVKAGEPGVVFTRGRERVAPPAGYDHFSR